MESEPGKAPKGRPKRGFWVVIQWIFLWGTIFGLTRSGAGRGDKQGGDLVEFGRVLRGPSATP